MPILRTCQECGKPYFARNSQEKRSKFCSHHCLIVHNNKSRKVDLTGKRFGRLLVIKEAAPKNGRIAYECICDCGKHITTLCQSLNNGEAKSCGCLGKEHAAIASSKACKKPIPPGKRFSRLVVIEENGTYRGSITYSCLCDCGKTITVRAIDLRYGGVQSCGCLKTELTKMRMTTHGRSKEPGFSCWRRETRKGMDSTWTSTMNKAIIDLQPACVICGATNKLSVDHVNPMSKGFGLEPGNAAVLCGSCNSRKNNKSLSDLPKDWQTKLKKAAKEFADYWKSISNC